MPAAFLASTGRPTVVPDVGESFFRSLRRTTQRDRERAAAHAGLLAELVARVEQRVVLPAVDLPQELALDSDDEPEAGEEAAVRLRELWDVPEGPVDHVVRLLERHGVVVARMPLLTKDVDAFSWTGGARPLVLLGADKGVYERSRLDAAHELAHVVLHAADPQPAEPRLERQAQRFGGALLFPADALRDEWPKGRLDWGRLLILRQRWGVSMNAILYRAKELGLMTPTSYENAMKYLSRKGWRVKEPGVARPPEEPALLGEAISLLESNGVALEQIAVEAHLLAADDLRDLLQLTNRPTLRVQI
jgi:Zn-dependent peptidase ImmA (M78 family)